MTDLDQLHSDSSSGNAWEDDGDHIWDDGDHVSYDRAIAEREWSRLNDTFGNTGYREGIEEGKEETLQQGFNQGWSEGVHYGHELGRLRGLISPLLEYLNSTSSSASTASSNSKLGSLQGNEKEAWIKKASELIKELIELDIAKIFDKAFFDDGCKPATNSLAAAEAVSGCCGGSSTKDSCCKKDTSASTTNGGDDISESTIHEPSSGGGCCSSRGDGSGSDPYPSEGCGSKEAESKSEWSSMPEQVIGSYRSRVHDMLQEVGLESLLEAV